MKKAVLFGIFLAVGIFVLPITSTWITKRQDDQATSSEVQAIIQGLRTVEGPKLNATETDDEYEDDDSEENIGTLYWKKAPPRPKYSIYSDYHEYEETEEDAASLRVPAEVTNQTNYAADEYYDYEEDIETFRLPSKPSNDDEYEVYDEPLASLRVRVKSRNQTSNDDEEFEEEN